MRREILLLLAATATLHAGPRASVNYTIATDTAGRGGGRATSASYTNDGTAGGVIGISSVAAPAEIAKHGYAGQLSENTGLTLTATSGSVNETATRQLGAWLVLDDASYTAVPAADVAWSVQSGPLTGIELNGLATAGTVYQNTAATAQGVHLGFTGTLGLTVVNTLLDNFGAYAGDGLGDDWQVLFFGQPPNVTAGPLLDPDGDGKNNLLEFGFGTDPTVNFSGPLVYTGTFAGGGTVVPAGQPIAKFESIPNGIDFRALFVRRKDSIAIGLFYAVEFSGDLENWQATNVIPSVLADDGANQIVSVPYPFFLVGGKKAQFFRVRVTSGP